MPLARNFAFFIAFLAAAAICHSGCSRAAAATDSAEITQQATPQDAEIGNEMPSATDASADQQAPDTPLLDAADSAIDAIADVKPAANDVAAADAPVPVGPVLTLHGAAVVGVGPAEVDLVDGKIFAIRVGVARGVTPVGATIVDISGKWLAPAFIDSHVHIVYLQAVQQMAHGGVAGIVDQAAPLAFFDKTFAPLVAIGSGPMITAVNGYPLSSWGANGYGIACATPDAATKAIELLAGKGAALIKLPFSSGPQLTAATVAAAMAAAHAHKLPVSVHTLDDASALLAGLAGADILAHTPVEALQPATLAIWKKRMVISSLAAFGGDSSTIANLAALHKAGTTVLYGTDFGNTSTPGIDGNEIALLQKAGLDGAAILAAGTSAPAQFWHMDNLGAIAVGKAASLLVLQADPLQMPQTLAQPLAVYLNGVEQ